MDDLLEEGLKVTVGLYYWLRIWSSVRMGLSDVSGCMSWIAQDREGEIGNKGETLIKFRVRSYICTAYRVEAQNHPSGPNGKRITNPVGSLTTQVLQRNLYFQRAFPLSRDVRWNHPLGFGAKE